MAEPSRQQGHRQHRTALEPCCSCDQVLKLSSLPLARQLSSAALPRGQAARGLLTLSTDQK